MCEYVGMKNTHTCGEQTAMHPSNRAHGSTTDVDATVVAIHTQLKKGEPLRAIFVLSRYLEVLALVDRGNFSPHVEHVAPTYEQAQRNGGEMLLGEHLVGDFPVS